MTLVAKGNGYIGSAGPRLGALLASERPQGQYTEMVTYKVEGMIAQMLRHTVGGGGGRAYVRREDHEKIKRDAGSIDQGLRQAPGSISFWRAAD